MYTLELSRRPQSSFVEHADFLCIWANHLQKMDVALEAGACSRKDWLTLATVNPLVHQKMELSKSIY